MVPPRTTPAAGGGLLSPDATLHRVIEGVCAALLQAESELTELDQKVGDGDLGDSLARAARSILAEIDTYPPESDPGEVLLRMSATVRRVVGGTSGPLYAVMLVRAAGALDGPSTNSGSGGWAAALTSAVAGVRELGGASPGDRTMVDALEPAAEAFNAELRKSADGAGALAAAVEAARRGAARTADLLPRLGRSSYLGERALGIPDPGAHAVSIWLAAIRV